MKSETYSKQRALENANSEIMQLEKKLLPATILSGFAMLALIPLAETIGEFLCQKYAGITLGFCAPLVSGVYYIKNVNRWLYEPICKKNNVTMKEWERFYLEKLYKPNS